MSLATLVNFSLPSANYLLELINQQNNQAFALTDLVFGNPTVGTTPTDTNVVVSPSSTTGLTGTVSIDYQRLDISTFFEGAQPTLYIQGTPSIQSVLDALLDQFQIYGTDGANDGFTITFNSDNTIATIVPNPNHFIWVGTLVAIIDPRPTLSALLSTTTLPGFSLPANQSPVCPNAHVYYGLVNGTSMVNELQVMQSGDQFNTYLNTWDIGTTLLNEPWYANMTPGAYNIYGASVLYNGAAVGPYAVPTSGGTYSGNILVLNLGPACTNRCGQLFIFYQPNTQSSGVPPSPPPDPAFPDLLYN